MKKKFRLLVVDTNTKSTLSSFEFLRLWEIKILSPLFIKEFSLFFPFHAVFIHTSSLASERQKEQLLQWLRSTKSEKPNVRFLATSTDSLENKAFVEKLLQAGVERFLKKPLIQKEMDLFFQKIEAWWNLEPTLSLKEKRETWIGNSPQAQDIRRQISELRGEKGPILIEGESGTGKELALNLLHQYSSGPLVTLNLAAIPENLFESEIFGYLRGAFTGANGEKIGLIETAENGDLFLDEMEALSFSLQAKLLRFIETGEFRRIGSQKIQFSPVRVIVATNKNLESMVRKGEFREDLFWRLEAKKIFLPPLRERKEDIQTLSKYFLEKDSIRAKNLNLEALKWLKDYFWPGNVRQLKQFCEKLLRLAPLPVIRKEDILKLMKKKNSSSLHEKKEWDFSKGLNSLIKEHEAFLIHKCLRECNDIDESAKVMKISRSSLYKKIKDHGIK